MKGLLCAIGVIGAIFSSNPAQACRGPFAHRALIHEGLPIKLPNGTFAAEVQFESTDENLLYGAGVYATVLRVVRGSVEEERLLVRPSSPNSCSRPFDNGSTGLIVAIPRGAERGTRVVEPLEAAAMHGYKLPEHYELPEGYIERIELNK